jgi:hypothetical protein
MVERYQLNQNHPVLVELRGHESVLYLALVHRTEDT